MILTFCQFLIVFGLGALIVLLSVIVAGVLVYKTKYAGHSMFHGEHEPKGDAFNIDDGFLDDPLETSVPERTEDPEDVKAASEKFLKQFDMDRMVKEAEKYAD